MNSPRLLLHVLVVTLVCAGVLGVAALVRQPSEPATAVVPAPGPRPEVDAALVLASWDRDRAAAWATGRPAAVRSLYVPRSSAGVADAAMLRAWRSRGLRVTGLRTQVLTLRVVRRSDTSLVLRVTDRVAAGSAVRGSSSSTLPAGSTGRSWGVVRLPAV